MNRASSVLRKVSVVVTVLLVSARVGTAASAGGAGSAGDTAGTFGSAGAAQIDLAGTLSFGAGYVPETWVPLRVEAHNRGPNALDGSVHVTPMDPLTPEYRSPIRVPGHSKVRSTMWVRLPAAAGKQPEISGLTLHDSKGARVQISELVGHSNVPALAYQPSGLASTGSIVAIVPSDTMTAENQFPDAIGEAVEAAMDWKVTTAIMDQNSAALASPAYSSSYAVALVGMDARRFDPAQRQAILDYVIGGGVLLIPGPEPEHIAGSWLEPYLPVRLVGKRQMEKLPLAGADPVSFGQWLPVTEAVAGDAADATVVWRDAEFVHAAYRPLGLGRIVFTSFPAGAMKGSDGQAQEFWRNVLWLDRPALGANGSKIASDYGKLMEPMLGRQAASWNLAIGAACAVVLLTIGAQFVWRGPARPKAFAASLGVSVVLAGGFAGMSMFRQQADPLQSAALTVADVSPQGSLLQQYAALAGPPQQLSQAAANNTTTIAPVLLREERPVASQWPARLGPISVAPGQVKQVTFAQAMLPGITGSVTAQFTQEGLQLQVENGTGADLGSAQLAWGAYRVTAGQFPTGASRHVVTGADVRPEEEYAAASGVVSQDQLQKGEILRALLQPREAQRGGRVSMNRALIAFADQLPALSSVEGAKVEKEARQNVVRMQVEVLPSPAGSPVRIDGPFNQIQAAQVKDLPFYAFRDNHFLRTAMEGSWVFSIVPPQEIGALELRHARLRLDLAAPQHKITLRRGQAVGGARKPNPNGEILGQWDGQVGLQTLEFDCQPGDFDAQGRLWLRLEAQQSGQAGSIGVEPHWQIQQLLVDLEGQVRGGAGSVASAGK